jgi:hypothetical protein
MTTSPVSGTYLDLSARTDTSLFTRSTTPAVVATSVSSSSTPVARARVPCPRRKPSLASTPGMSSPGLTKATARAAFGTGACSSAFFARLNSRPPPREAASTLKLTVILFDSRVRVCRQPPARCVLRRQTAVGDARTGANGRDANAREDARRRGDA